MYEWEIDLELVWEWLLTLDERSYNQVRAALEILRSEGPQLGRPLVDRVTGSSVNNMKELRAGSSGRSELRLLFVFDPKQKAIMLVGGDKTGLWNKWYRKNIRLAEARYEQYLEAKGLSR